MFGGVDESFLYENLIAPIASSVFMLSWSHTETVIVSTIVGHSTGTSSCCCHTGSRLPGTYDDTVGVMLPNWSWTYGSTPPRPMNCEKSRGVKPSPRVISQQIEWRPWITYGAISTSRNAVTPFITPNFSSCTSFSTTVAISSSPMSTVMFTLR